MADKGTRRLGTRALEVDDDVVAFVRLGFGDSHGLRMRSLRFEVAIPNRATLEAALIHGVVGYNRMSGKVAARKLGPLWDDLSYTYLGRDNDAYLGRESDPYLRLWLPHNRQQRNGPHTGLFIHTTEAETADLIERIKKAAKACAATALIRSTGRTPSWSLATPADPAEMLLIWQD